jgi:hypothetical protein
MKMVKTLLLGTAAGLVAVTTGQAADLPVKAKPVEYVKVCNLYGAGFYYMPGSDICLKIGGYVRAETTYHSNGNFTQGPTSGFLTNATTNEFVMRARAYITADAREQTAYGTARAYVAVGVATADTGSPLTPSILGFNRAFIQWAGLTVGITQSFYDFYSGAATGYRAYNPTSDTGDSGWWVWAYTAQLGNGFSASISAEQRRSSQIINVTSGSVAGIPTLGTFVSTGIGAGGVTDLTAVTNLGSPGLFGATAPNSNGTINGIVNPTNGYGGIQVPDIVGNLRYDQTWGSAQVMGAAHMVNANYYDTTPATGAFPAGGCTTAACIAGPGSTLATTDRPSTQWGFVLGAGLRLNFPVIAPGDFFQSQVNYTQGGLRYLMMGDNSPNMQIERGGKYGFGVTSDCVYASYAAGGVNAVAAATGSAGSGTVFGATNTTGCQLTTAWSLNAAYEHYWTPQFHESLLGSYLATSYNTLANNNLCLAEQGLVATGFTGGTPNPFKSPTGSTAPATPGCNNNWQLWTVGTRLQYDFTKTLYLGVELLYQHLNTATVGTGATLNQGQINAIGPPGNGLIAGSSHIADENVLSATLRMHKDFLP